MCEFKHKMFVPVMSDTSVKKQHLKRKVQENRRHSFIYVVSSRSREPQTYKPPSSVFTLESALGLILPSSGQAGRQTVQHPDTNKTLI